MVGDVAAVINVTANDGIWWRGHGSWTTAYNSTSKSDKNLNTNANIIGRWNFLDYELDTGYHIARLFIFRGWENLAKCDH